MDKKKMLIKIWASIVTMFLIAVTFTAATYAWFTSNRVVNTDKVDTRSGSSELKLEVSSYGGESFSGSTEAAIVQINDTSATGLFPVSTADLKTFVYNTVLSEGMATQFRTVTDEKYYYHGRVYLRAVGEGLPEESRMALYLDEGQDSGGTLVSADAGLLLNAARLGLSFDGSENVIFYLSDQENAAEERVENTVLNGQKLANGFVLEQSGGVIREVTDPSVALSDYVIKINGGQTVLPEKPLLYMELNRIYPVDIYFYLEGCDPDCSDSVSNDGADLYLAFYGILTE